MKNSNHDFINNSRADVVDLNDGIIYEILCSEKEEIKKNRILVRKLINFCRKNFDKYNG